jgi:hypothetical protein
MQISTAYGGQKEGHAALPHNKVALRRTQNEAWSRPFFRRPM